MADNKSTSKSAENRPREADGKFTEKDGSKSFGSSHSASGSKDSQSMDSDRKSSGSRSASSAKNDDKASGSRSGSKN